MQRLRATHPAPFALALALTIVLVALSWCPAYATFHIANISKVMCGFNGDSTIQAVEIKMTTGGQNLVSAMQIVIYNGSGTLVATLGTFPANVPNGLGGDNILCATPKFQTTFGIIPDLVITPGIPVTSGQVVYEKVGCRVNGIPYGNVTTPLAGPTVAAPLPRDGAAVLVRTIDDPTSPTCPLSEDAAARMALRTGSPTNPIVFRNNARTTVNVFSTVTGTGGSPPVTSALQASPNPFRGTTTIVAPDWRPLSVYNIQGRLVRVLTCLQGGACPGIAGPFRGEWDGTDSQGREVPSGIYFLRYAGANGIVVKRIALLR